MSGLESSKQAEEYLPRLKAVFFARWDADRGCEISSQVPPNSVGITSTAPNLAEPPMAGGDKTLRTEAHQSGNCLFEFSDVLDFVLPKKHLCGHLVTISAGQVKIIGFPTLIEDDCKYERNFLMFNLCFVFERDAELSAYEPAVRKTGRVLRSLEEKHSLLSDPDSPLEVKSMLEGIFEGLNSSAEASIAFGPSHSLDLKLFPFYDNPPPVEDWDVPVPLVPLSKLCSDVTWDLTMCKLVPYLDGVATVRKISRKADVDLDLTRECIQHLVFYRCCIMTDLFRFSNYYTLVGGPALDALGDSSTPESRAMQSELVSYVESAPGALRCPVSHLLALYADLKSGLSVHDWMEDHELHKLPLDVRRFMSFGTTKGFLRRVHCYPIWALHPDTCRSRPKLAPLAGPKLTASSPGPTLSHADRRGSRFSSSSLREPSWLAVLKRLNVDPESTPKPQRRYSKRAHAPPPAEPNPIAVRVPQELPMKLDGSHHLDEICVEYQLSLPQLEQILRYIDTLSLQECSDQLFSEDSAMQTILY